MTKADIIEQAKALFQSYPSVAEFYFTNDGNAFEQRHTAESHANTLADKMVVTTVTRQEIEEPGSENESRTEDGSKNETPPVDDGTTTEGVQASTVKKKNK